MVDTSAHAVTSKKYGIKRFGLGQSAGGHYVIPIDQVSDMQPVPSDFSLQPQHEVFPVSAGAQWINGEGVTNLAPHRPDCALGVG